MSLGCDAHKTEQQEPSQQGDISFSTELISALLDGLNYGETSGFPVQGLIVVSQTCDVVGNSAKKPFLELCALVKVDPLLLKEIKKRKRSRYAFVPSKEDACLVADLAITRSFLKSSISTSTWGSGGFDQNSERGSSLASFQNALAKWRARFAFPDNFHPVKSFLHAKLKKLPNDLQECIEEVSVSVEVEQGKVVRANFLVLIYSPEEKTISDEQIEALNEKTSALFSQLNEKINTIPSSYRIADPTEIVLDEYRKYNPVDFDDVS